MLLKVAKLDGWATRRGVSAADGSAPPCRVLSRLPRLENRETWGTRHNALIGEAVVLGDKHKFPAVLIAPFSPVLEDWARANQVVCSSREDLVAHPKVRTLYEGIVGDLNQSLARFEQLKRVILIAEEFSPENGALTASMKLRRRVVEERYRVQIEAMYAEAEVAGVGSKVE